MDTPTYPVSITIGGPDQTTESGIGSVLPRTIVTRQSGKIIITASNNDGGAFSLASLNGKEVFAKPFNSAEVPVSLGIGVVSGAGSEIFTITWVRDLFPAGWSSFADDREGAIVIYVEMEETGVEDFFQWSTRVNVDDGDYTGDAATLPLVNLIFYYNPLYGYDNTTADADPGAGNFRLNNTLVASATEMYIADDNQSSVDIQTMIQNLAIGTGVYISNPNVKTDAAYFTVSGAITDNSGYSTVPLTFVDSGTSSFTNGTILSFSFLSTGVADDSITNTKLADMAQDTIKGRITAGAGDPEDLTGAQVRTVIDFDAQVSANSAVAANTSKVTNATHTGDAAGATALTLQNAAITGKTTVTAVGTDFALISDTSDSGNLKKALISDFGGGAGSDTTAIHDDTPGEIVLVTEKVTPVAADLILIEDSADSNNKKRVQVGNLPGTGGGAGIAANWTFSTAITATDPGAAGIKYNNATPASVTAIFINVASNNTADFEVFISSLGGGDTIYLQQLDDDADFLVFNVTSSVDNTGWYTINGTIADSGTLPADASDVGVNFGYTGAGAGASVTSIFGRTLAVLAVASDYDASQVDNDSTVTGAFVDDALNTLDTDKVETIALAAGATGVDPTEAKVTTELKLKGFTGINDANVTIVGDDIQTDVDVNAAIDKQAIAAGTDNDQTGVAYTLVLTDGDLKTVWMNNAAANILTIPPNSGVAFAVGTKINVMMEGVGVTTVLGDTGVTVNGGVAGSVVINNRYQGCTLTKRAVDTWIVSGDVT